MSVSCKASQLCKDAGVELGVSDPIEAQPASIARFFLNKLNRLLDNFNADGAAIYNQNFTTGTIVPALQPHLIGPTGTVGFVVDQRPVSIEAGSIVLPEDVKVPLRIRDDEWWANLIVPSVTTTLPTDLYYSATWPNGSIYLWPVPSAAYGLFLQTRLVLSNVGFDDVLTLPPGYRDMLTLCLAEDCIVPMARSADPRMPKLVQAAAAARARVWANNDDIPRLVTQDAGIPTGGRQLPYFNWRSGWPR